MTDAVDHIPPTECENKLRREHEELVRLFKLVQVAKQEWEKSMDCVDDMVILADMKDNIKRCNKALREFTGKSYQEILGKNWNDLLAQCGIKINAWHGKGLELQHGQSGRWFLLNTYPAAGIDENAVSGTVITIHDTTELKQMTRELERKNREVEQAYEELKATQARILQQEKMASIGQLAAGVAHEINNPMGFIGSNLGTLNKYMDRVTEFVRAQSEVADAALSPEAAATLREKRSALKIDYILDDTRKLISESLDGADRVKTIVQNLKSFSRVDQAEQKHASINECIDTTINIAWNELKYKTTLHKEYGDLPLTKCWPQQLNQVFMNLLVNAAHAIEKQGVVTIRTWAEAGSVFASISDTGMGILPENLGRIFEPFFTTKEVGKGTGLGLSIAYDIIKKHNGDISVQSEIGKGTTFTLRIPIVEGR